MKFILVAVLALSPGCALLGEGKSVLDLAACEANEDNVAALVSENNLYTATDATIPSALKATRAARNLEALNLATRLSISASGTEASK